MRTKKNKSSKPAEVKSLEILSFRMRSEKELRDKLAGYEYSPEEVEKALQYVKSYGYINDEAYAEQYVASRSSQKGRTALRLELLKKGIPSDKIEAALETLEVSEEDTAYELLIKKAGEPHELEEKEFAKLYRFLMGRGFSGSTSYSVLKRYKNGAE